MKKKLIAVYSLVLGLSVLTVLLIISNEKLYENAQSIKAIQSQSALSVDQIEEEDLTAEEEVKTASEKEWKIPPKNDHSLDNVIQPEVINDEPKANEPQVIAEVSSEAAVTAEPEAFSGFRAEFVGDCYFEGTRLAGYRKDGINSVMSEELMDLVRTADFAFFDFEGAFTNITEPEDQTKEYNYRMPKEDCKAFADMGFDVVSFSNNHSLDFGTDGLTDSFEAAEAAGIKYVGAGKDRERAEEPAVFTVGGKTIAVLAASRVIPVTSWNILQRQPGMLCTYDPKELCECIAKARELYDYVIVYAHWGIMNEEQPQDYQVNMAHQYIDAGADVVMGSHTHCLQRIDIYNGKPIYYGLGNFLYSQNINRTFMLSIECDSTGVVATRIIPCYAKLGCNYIYDKQSGRQLFDYLESISSGIQIDDNGYLRSSY